MKPVALVTGATRGVGLAITRELVSEGWLVWGIYRNDHKKAEKLQLELKNNIYLLSADLNESAKQAEILHQLQQKNISLNGVVFNAGIRLSGDFRLHSLHGVDPLTTQVRSNLLAPLELCRLLLANDRLASSASLVFISSNLARRGLAEKVGYATTKAGIEGAARSLAKELGPRGIRVNVVAPGLLSTDMTRDLDAASFEAYAQEVPLRRVGKAKDIAPMVAFLLSKKSHYITGQIIDIDGGWNC